VWLRQSLEAAFFTISDFKLNMPREKAPIRFDQRPAKTGRANSEALRPSTNGCWNSFRMKEPVAVTLKAVACLRQDGSKRASTRQA
jgi:hypothetical protein